MKSNKKVKKTKYSNTYVILQLQNSFKINDYCHVIMYVPVAGLVP